MYARRSYGQGLYWKSGVRGSWDKQTNAKIPQKPQKLSVAFQIYYVQY